jgi:hypothetical protein
MLSKNDPLPEPELKVVEKAANVDMDVFIDGTYSMSGFVNYANRTVYGEALKEIERTARGLWKNENITYIKFGDEFQKLSREQFLQCEHTGFYDQKDTSLQNVVDRIDEKKISIIVTDLFQTDQDVENLLLSIKKKGLAVGDSAVAILGMKSQFNGKIYDVGKNKVAFDYVSTNESNFRPFYFLVFGRDYDVREFILAFRESMKGETLLAFFSKNIGVNSKLLVDKDAKTDKKSVAVPLAKISSLVKSDAFLQYRLKTDEQASQVNLLVTSENVCNNISGDFTLGSVQVYKWENGAMHPVGNKSFLETEAGELLLENGKGSLSCALKILPKGISKKKGSYQVLFSFSAGLSSKVCKLI